MTFAAGARHDLSFVPEVTFGVTPTTPAMKQLRYVTTTLNLSKNAIESEEMYADGQTRDLRHGNRRIAGDIVTEMSYGAHDDLLAALLGGAWSSNVLKRGVLIPSFTVERRHNDVAQFLPYTGIAMNTGSIVIQPDAIVRCTYGVVGRNMSTASATSLGAPTDVATNPPFDSFSGALMEGGATIASVTSLQIDVNNGFDPAFVIGSAMTPQFIPGKRAVTGSISAYFENATLLNKFVNEVESSLEVTLDGPAGGDLTIKIPRLKYTGGELPVSGVGGVMLNLPWTALRSAADATNITITRAPA